MRFFGSGFLNKPNINLPNRLLGDFGFIQNFAEIFGNWIIVRLLRICLQYMYSFLMHMLNKHILFLHISSV